MDQCFGARHVQQESRPGEPARLAHRPRQTALGVEGKRVLIQTMKGTDHNLDGPARWGGGILDRGRELGCRGLAVNSVWSLSPPRARFGAVGHTRGPYLGQSIFREPAGRRVSRGADVSGILSALRIVLPHERLNSITNCRVPSGSVQSPVRAQPSDRSDVCEVARIAAAHFRRFKLTDRPTVP